MRRIKLPHRELSWLPNSELKGLLLPPIYVIDDSDDYSGYYEHGDSESRGEIVVVENEYYASTLAHEFRHYWQFVNFGLPDESSRWNNEKDYRTAIVEYFCTQAHEADALMFECKHAPNDVNLQWLEWIRHDTKRIDERMGSLAK